MSSRYICVYMYIYVCVYVCTSIYVGVYIHTYIFVYIHRHTHTHTFITDLWFFRIWYCAWNEYVAHLCLARSDLCRSVSSFGSLISSQPTPGRKTDWKLSVCLLPPHLALLPSPFIFSRGSRCSWGACLRAGQGEPRGLSREPWTLHHLNTTLREWSEPERWLPWDRSNLRALRNHFPGRCILGRVEAQVTVISSGPRFLWIYTCCLPTTERNLITSRITYR